MRCAAILTLVFTCAMVTGCTPQQPAMAPASIAKAQQHGHSAQSLRHTLTNTDNGLEIRRLTIVDRAASLVTALTALAQPWPDNAIERLRLRRNGLRCLRMDQKNVESLLASVGPLMVDATEWHGQVLDWRALQERPVEAGGCAVTVDGRVSRYGSGEFRLMLRGWTAPMECGPRMYVELVPQHRIPGPPTLRRLWDGQDRLAQGFDSASLSTCLETGFVYVLVGETPASDWGALDGPLDESDANHRRAKPRRVGPGEIGPDAAAPLTLGELLLGADHVARTRPLLLLVPRIPAQLTLPHPQPGGDPMRNQARRRNPASVPARSGGPSFDQRSPHAPVRSCAIAVLTERRARSEGTDQW